MQRFGRQYRKREEGGVLPGIAVAVLITALAIALSYDPQASAPEAQFPVHQRLA